MAFVGADRIQHLRWDEIMAFHPQAVEYYQMLDQALGMALDALQADDLLMLVSDHGFQGVRRKFYIHEYLYRRGFLKMRGGGNRRRIRALAIARQVILTLRLQKLARLVRGQLRQVGVMDVVKEHHAAYLPDLDWRNTHAWLPSSSGFIAGYADIFLDDTLSEEVIQQLMIDLKELRDPDTSLPLITEMYREQAFGAGTFAPGERHLIILAGENTTMPTELGRSALWETSDVTAGIHHPDGVLYLYGAGVKHDTVIAPKHVYDVAPTILSFMGVPLPNDLDGKAITDVYEESFVLGQSGGEEHDGIVKMKLKKLVDRQSSMSR
jgi:predicted AlkP superfamily phosphohydrolase/phosphomutase